VSRGFFASFFQSATIGFFRIVVFVVTMTVGTVPLVHKKVHQWAHQYYQDGKKGADMCAVLNQ
jgi:hypothetical protein